jgi:membrane fusion protein (multidrug efflux system)
MRAFLLTKTLINFDSVPNHVMKNFLSLSLITFIIFSCSPGSSLEKKKAQLAEYQAEHDALKIKIADLEKEIARLDTSAEIRKPKLVTLTPVQSGVFNHYIDVQGTVDSEENIAVQPGMPGQVTKVNVHEGDMVKAGQILAEVDNRVIRESISQLQTNVDFAKTAFEKQQRLWNQKIGTEIQYLQSKTQFESLQKNMVTLQAQLDMSRIKSPINGMVDAVNIKVGEYAAPGMFGAFRVVNFGKMKVIAKVADSYIGKVKLGNPVRIYLADINDTIQGKISFISKVVNPMTRTFDIEIGLGATSTEVRPNMMASLKINDENIANAMSILSNLVQKDASGSMYVMISEGIAAKMKARKKLVKTGISSGDRIIVLEGLSGNEQLIEAGYQEVVDGQLISLK